MTNQLLGILATFETCLNTLTGISDFLTRIEIVGELYVSKCLNTLTGISDFLTGVSMNSINLVGRIWSQYPYGN